MTAERIISADSHVAMKPDQAKAFLASRFHVASRRRNGRAPKAIGGWRREFQRGPALVSRSATGTVPHMADMDLDGLAAEAVYCEVSAFRWLYRMREGAVEATRCQRHVARLDVLADPHRLVVSYQIPLHDIADAIAEVQRIVAFGGRSLQIPVFPVELGLPDYYHERYEPLWAAVCEVGLPLCCHIGANAALDDLAERDPTPCRVLVVPQLGLTTVEAFGMWILGGVLERFPTLQLVFVEPGLGWVSWWLDSIMMWSGARAMRRRGDLAEAKRVLPSPGAPNVHGRAQQHRSAPRPIGVDNILWASDYPHPPTTWPNSRDSLARQFAGVPDEDRRKIVCDNAARLWGL